SQPGQHAACHRPLVGEHQQLVGHVPGAGVGAQPRQPRQAVGTGLAPAVEPVTLGWHRTLLQRRIGATPSRHPTRYRGYDGYPTLAAAGRMRGVTQAGDLAERALGLVMVDPRRARRMAEVALRTANGHGARQVVVARRALGLAARELHDASGAAVE